MPKITWCLVVSQPESLFIPKWNKLQMPKHEIDEFQWPSKKHKKYTKSKKCAQTDRQSLTSKGPTNLLSLTRHTLRYYVLYSKYINCIKNIIYAMHSTE